MRGVASAIIGRDSKFMPLLSAHAHGTNIMPWTMQDTVNVSA